MEDIFSKIDESLENVNYDENRDKSFRRYCYTWNNPFFNDEFEEVDIENTDLLKDLEHYDLHNLKTDFNKDFFEFRYIKYEDYKTHEFKVIERPFFKDANSIRNYLTNFSTFKGQCFQIEKGGNCETTHIQGFIVFKHPMTWSTFKNYFPCAHFNRAISRSSDCVQYCSKLDTRIDGPFKDGDIVDQGGRTDIKEFLGMIDNGCSNKDLKEYFPTLYLHEYNKIEKIRNENVFDKFKKTYRNVEVTYVYGPSRCGKSSYIVKKYGYGNFYNVDTYRYGPYDGYSGEDVIVFDEFHSQVEITLFNKLLDGHPVQLPCRFENKWACYTKIYIISNLTLDKQYMGDNIEPAIREAFLARIHNIIRFDSMGNMFYEKHSNIRNQISIDDSVNSSTEIKMEEIDTKELDDIF